MVSGKWVCGLLSHKYRKTVKRRARREETHSDDLKQSHTSLAIFSTACYDSHATIIYEPDDH